MKDEEGSAMKTPSSCSKRTSLKTQSNFNNYSLWKYKVRPSLSFSFFVFSLLLFRPFIFLYINLCDVQLRENCYRRVRQDRSRLLWKTRLSAANSQVRCFSLLILLFKQIDPMYFLYKMFNNLCFYIIFRML